MYVSKSIISGYKRSQEGSSNIKSFKIAEYPLGILYSDSPVTPLLPSYFLHSWISEMNDISSFFQISNSEVVFTKSLEIQELS